MIFYTMLRVIDLGTGTVVTFNNQCIKDRANKTVEYCCEGCKYLIDHKCSVKSLGCKLCICQLIRERDIYMKGFLDALQYIKSSLQIPGEIRESKEDAFDRRLW